MSKLLTAVLAAVFALVTVSPVAFAAKHEMEKKTEATKEKAKTEAKKEKAKAESKKEKAKAESKKEKAKAETKKAEEKK